MMKRIIENSQGHELKNQKILLSHEYPCVACSQGKLIVRPSHTKVKFESSIFLERVHGDICGPIHPPCGHFWYFMVLIDASTRWSHVCLIATRNIALSRLLAQIIKLRAQFPDYPIKSIRLDNAGEFTSQTFNDYCMSVGINIKHPIAHTHYDTPIPGVPLITRQPAKTCGYRVSQYHTHLSQYIETYSFRFNS